MTLTFEVTHLCNLACVYCDRHTPMPNEMGRDEIFTALAQFVDMGMIKLNLSGGEPLAHRHVAEIVEWTTDQGIKTKINTNGILVSKKIETVKRLSHVKISLDGPRENHDLIRGKGSFDKALAGAMAAREAGVPKVDFTCVVGQHNAETVDTLIDMVEEMEMQVTFQPARNSLYLDTERDGSEFQLEDAALMAAFGRIEKRKRHSKAVGNRWSSLRHFRTFPNDTKIPCAAGWTNSTMDAEGNLYHCGLINRHDRSANVVRLGVRAAFEGLNRRGCSQCWCARIVERNYRWGGRFDKLIPLY